MTFSFTSGYSQDTAPICVDLCLEAVFEDGKIIQATTIRTTAGTTLVYRESTSGKWLSTAGISFNGLPRTPENLIKTLGSREPVRLVYVMPAA